jgi:hypothetical protein
MSAEGLMVHSPWSMVHSRLYTLNFVLPGEIYQLTDCMNALSSNILATTAKEEKGSKRCNILSTMDYGP